MSFDVVWNGTPYTLFNAGEDWYAGADQLSDLLRNLAQNAVTLTTAQTLSNKTLVNPTIDSINGVNVTDYARLSQSNTFTQTQTINDEIVLEGTFPVVHFHETNAAANEGHWHVHADAGQLVMQTRTDADGPGAIFFVANRNGTAVDSIALSATAITLNGVNVTDYARLSQSQTFTGINTFGNSDTVFESTSGAILRMRDTDAATNLKRFRVRTLDGTWYVSSENDAGTEVQRGIQIIKNPADGTISEVELNATTLDFNGAADFSSSVAVNGASFGAGNGITILGTGPFLHYDDTDAAADESLWGWGINSNQFRLVTMADATPSTIAATPINVQRSGTTITEIQLDATTLDFNGNFDAITVTGAGAGSAAVNLSNALPRLRLTETDAAADNQVWYIDANAEQFAISAVNDALGVVTDAIRIDRTGTTIDLVQLLATEVDLTATTFDFNGTLNVAGTASHKISDAESLPTLNMNGATPLLSIGGAGAGAGFAMFQRYNNASGGPDIAMYHSRGATVGTHTILQNGDEIGSISFYASDGTSTPVKTARIIGKVNGAVGSATDLPSRIEILTTPDGSATSQIVAMFSPEEIDLAATTLDFNGAASVSGQLTLEAAGPSMVMTNTRPTIVWDETDGGANQRRSEIGQSGGTLYWELQNDAGASGTTLVTVTRSGSTATQMTLNGGSEIQLDATTLDFNGNVVINDLSFSNAAELTADLDLFTSSLQGVVPASGGGTANYLRADGTWAAPGAAISEVAAGAGLTGGGTSGVVTLNVGAGSGISVAADSVAVDSTVVRTSGAQSIAGVKTFTDQIIIDQNTSPMLRLSATNGSPWAIELFREDLATGSKVFNNGNTWYFEHNISIAGNTNWHSGNDGAGSGLDADTLDGLNLGPDGGYSANTVGRYNASGYFFANYFNQASGNSENPTVSQIMVTNGSDNYLRKADARHAIGSQGFWSNTGQFTYGGQFVSGAANGYYGITVNDGVYYPTLMSNGSTKGIYMQGTNWMIYQTGTGAVTSPYDITANSDLRLKEDVQPITNALNKVLSLSGYTFFKKDKNGKRLDDKRHAGVVAQEVEKVLPEVVDVDEDGIKSVAYGNIAALLIESDKELYRQIDELRAEIRALKAA